MNHTKCSLHFPKFAKLWPTNGETAEITSAIFAWRVGRQLSPCCYTSSWQYRASFKK